MLTVQPSHVQEAFLITYMKTFSNKELEVVDIVVTV